MGCFKKALGMKACATFGEHLRVNLLLRLTLASDDAIVTDLMLGKEWLE